MASRNIKKPSNYMRMITVCCGSNYMRKSGNYYCTNCYQKTRYRRATIDDDQPRKVIAVHCNYGLSREEEIEKRSKILKGYETMKLTALERPFIMERIQWNTDRLNTLIFK